MSGTKGLTLGQNFAKNATRAEFAKSLENLSLRKLILGSYETCWACQLANFYLGRFRQAFCPMYVKIIL
jgi:hypothetical protein